MRKEKGNVGDLLTTGVCVLVITILMFSYMDAMWLLRQKTEVAQIARRYILRMETVGCLEGEDYAKLCSELTEAGVTELNLNGSTIGQVGYGQPVVLYIQGKIGGEYEFTEKRVSTAKN